MLQPVEDLDAVPELGKAQWGVRIFAAFSLSFKVGSTLAKHEASRRQH
jgi:hypothetical protein